ncbi:hypothetical protein J0H58_12750 [bacterium]|nr:hypothetical protein [bacterium]
MIDLTATANGTHRQRTQAGKRAPKREAKKTSRPRSKRTRTGAGRRTAMVLGSVAAGLVALSIYHLTCAISTLTGSPLVLAVLLSFGIDLGLVASEVAEMIAGEDGKVQRWSRSYMLMATVMSMLLNAYEFAAHAPPHWFSQTLSVGFGLALPLMVYILARQAGGLWGKP